MKLFKVGGFTGEGNDSIAGIVHPGQVFLPRSAFDKLGIEAVRNLYGPGVQISVIEDQEEGQA